MSDLALSPLSIPLLGSRARVEQPVLSQYLNRLPTALFLAVFSDVSAASFGMLIIVPAATGLPSTAGLTIFLLSTITGQLAACLFSGFEYAVAGATLELVPLLIAMNSLVDPSLSEGERASTVLAMTSMTSLLVGLMLIAVSRLKLGGLFRCVPLVVLRGALTGVGVFMILEGIKTGGNTELQLADLADVVEPPTLTRVLATLLLYGGLSGAQRLSSSPFVTMGYLGAAAMLLHAISHAMSLLGLLPLDSSWWFTVGGDTSDTGVAVIESPFGLLSLFDVRLVSISCTLRALPYALSCVLVHSLCTVTDLVSVEAIVTTKRSSTESPPCDPFDLDTELGSIGFANLFAACVGAMPSYVQMSPSIINTNFSKGVPGRHRAGPLVCLVSAASLFAVLQVVSVVPRPVVGAFMVSMGVSFAGEGAETLRHTVDPVDSGLILVMPALMLGVGFLPGLLVGLLVALLHFIIIYSRAPILRFHKTGATLVSNTVRPYEHRQCLEVHGGHAITILSLHGFLMFGSAPQLARALAEVCRERSAWEASQAECGGGACRRMKGGSKAGGSLEASLAAPSAMEAARSPREAPWFVVLDMRVCQGCDFGAAEELAKMAELVGCAGGNLRLAEPPPHVERAIYRVARGRVHDLSSFQDTLRACEDSLIEALAPTKPPGAVAMPSTDVQAVALFLRPGQLDAGASLRIEGLATSLLSLAHRRTVAKEEVVWRPEDDASSFLLVLSGTLELMYDGVHVERLVPGSSCGFLFMFARGKRDTLMVCSSDATVLVISRHLFDTMQASHPGLQQQLREGMMARVATEYQHYVRHHASTHSSPSVPARKYQ